MGGKRPWFIARRRSNRSPSSKALKGCKCLVRARPPRRLTPPWRSFRALEPVRRKWTPLSSISECTSSKRDGIFWISSMITILSFEASHDSRSRRGERLSWRYVSLSKRLKTGCPFSSWRIIQDLPVCLGPKRKQDFCFSDFSRSRALGMFILIANYTGVYHNICP